MSVPTVGSLDELRAELRKAFEPERKPDVEFIKALLAAYKSNPDDWKRQYAHFDPNKYTRNLVDTGNGHYNLILLCWGEGQGTAIHDHSDAHCFVKIMEGQIKETLYAWPVVGDEGQTVEKVPKPMIAMGEIKHYPKDAVTYINDTIGLHRVENDSNVERAVTLHLYTPPFQTCQMFDDDYSKATTVQMTYYSQFGERTPVEDQIRSCERK